MGFKATVYFNDADIYSTNIQAENGAGVKELNTTKYYGNSAFTSQEFAGSVLLKFTATPADGCEFTKWKYRIGDEIYDDDIDARESTYNPFYYSGTEDIVIRAEGQPIGSGGDEPELQIWSSDLIYEGTVTNVYNDGLDLAPYTIYIYALTFEDSGIATFYSMGNDDTRAWLSNSNRYSTESGWPTGSILASNDDYTDHNFYFTYNVTSDETYYLFVRLLGGSYYGYTDLRVEPPTKQITTIAKWDWNIVNGSFADEYQAYAAHQALLTKGYTTDFSYRVWVDLVDKVVEIQDEMGYSWDTTYGRYMQTTMSPSDTELTAKRFNALRNNLELVGISLGLYQIPNTTNHDEAPEGTIPHPVESGKPVFAHYFFTLTDYINDCIDRL